jgi:trehalose 6-phosphate synthase/phosphatase
MPKRELKKRFTAMQDQLSNNTVHHWAGNFMKNLQQPVASRQMTIRTPSLTPARIDKILSNYRLSSKRLLLLDYDGTLEPHAEHYTHANPPAKLLHLLERLSGDEKNEVVLISGRSKDDLQEWFGNTNLNLIAEHGAIVKSAGHKTWHETVTSGRRWKKTVLPILQHYTDLTPAAHIEEKQYSLVWHYRQSPAFASQKNLQILQRVLRPITGQFGLELFNGSKILEIKDPGINKGNAVRRWLRREHDFVLVVGDDFTDEDMFAAVPASATTVKVGRGRTIANYRAANSDDVVALLTQLK